MGITPQSTSLLPFDQPPEWAKKAIWYQIFVERFRNGNVKVNPNRETCANALIDPFPEDWTLTPWGHNWYKQEEWAQKTNLDFYRTIQMRRYGGDLEGVLEKIPYLLELGITAIYFNPLNDAPSLHKYDARFYHHIDVTFGDDIEGDIEMITKENPEDPSTWTWTSADNKFLLLIERLHKVGIKVILDFSWNHTGVNFWAFKDIVENKSNSKYKDWYHISFEEMPSGKDEMRYDGWNGINHLPELKKVDVINKIPGQGYEGDIHIGPKEHIYNVCKRWIDPYGNGDYTRGIDGMRLDVAEHVPMGFWRDFRKYTRSIHPEFYLVGENWWKQWPDELMDPTEWVKGDVFDAVMHYQWYKLARGYFAKPNDKISKIQFENEIEALIAKNPSYTQQVMMNLASSHDSPRLLTAFFNINKYKYKCKPHEDHEYRTQKPGEITYHQVKLFLLHQFTFIGAPHIWNGDEMGMLGADDPDNRKPLVWKDINFEMETESEESSYTYSEKVVFDEKMFEYYKSLIILRKSSDAFSIGSIEFLKNLGTNILAYYRRLNNENYLIIFNCNLESNVIVLPTEILHYDMVFEYHLLPVKKADKFKLSAYSGIVIKIK